MTCIRCGECCLRYNPFSGDNTGRCPQLVFEGEIGTCLLHESERPQICLNYPKEGEKCIGIELRDLKDYVRILNGGEPEMELVAIQKTESGYESTYKSITSLDVLINVQKATILDIQKKQEEIISLQSRLDKINEQISCYQKATDKVSTVDELKAAIVAEGKE
jgi:hypothetical protein